MTEGNIMNDKIVKVGASIALPVVMVSSFFEHDKESDLPLESRYQMIQSVNVSGFSATVSSVLSSS